MLPNQAAVGLEGECNVHMHVYVDNQLRTQISSDAFCLFYDASTKSVSALNGSGHSPKKLTIDHVRSRGVTGAKIPLTDLNSVTVPGAAAAWVDTVEIFGSGKLSVADVLAPAIRLAEEGCALITHKTRSST